MDTSRDIIESNRPPRPPRPGSEGEHAMPAVPRFVPVVVVLAAVACAAFTGITAWETHQDRLNNARIYCTFYVDSLSDEGQGYEPTEREVQRYRALGEQLGC